jgi:flagellar biosynthesis/type III secretory pathway protein FliH
VSLEAWEEEAEAFHQATGYLRPGKDDARGIHSEEERRAAWIGWSKGVASGWDDGFAAGREDARAEIGEALDVQDEVSTNDYDDGYDDGYDQGYDNGYNEGVKAGEVQP